MAVSSREIPGLYFAGPANWVWSRPVSGLGRRVCKTAGGPVLVGLPGHAPLFLGIQTDQRPASRGFLPAKRRHLGVSGNETAVSAANVPEAAPGSRPRTTPRIVPGKAISVRLCRELADCDHPSTTTTTNTATKSAKISEAGVWYQIMTFTHKATLQIQPSHSNSAPTTLRRERCPS